nr:tryptophan synthase subunit alpha [Maliibacterium massiliense]
MSKIAQAFAHGKAFIAFVTGGDPDIATSEELICAMAEGGADAIEIGIPFSDPIAEGPVIQAASARALAAGASVDALCDMVARVRRRVDVPLLFMTYANPIFAYGSARFMQRAAAAGIDGLIVPDVPFEEKDEFAAVCDAHGIDLISMVAPTSKARARAIAREARGFLYCVSSLGVTGVRAELGASISEVIRQAKQAADIPCAIGFGIATKEQARQMAAYADGVIVGSAIVRLVAAHGRQSVPVVRDYVRGMKQALVRAGLF